MICERKSPLGVVLYSEIDPISRVMSISGSVYKDQRSEINNKDLFDCGLDFAFEILNAYRVEAEVLECNLPAQQLEIDHLGFRIEGVKRQSVYKSGKYYNSLVLGLLREEWEIQRFNGYSDKSCNLNFDHELAEKLIKQSRKEIQ